MAHLFRNDYSEIAHPNVLKKLLECSKEQNVGYGLDKHTLNASNLIKQIFNVPNSDVYFLTGGTQTNMVLISYALRHYESVIACETGHINVHETGAVDGSGHKINAVKGISGKVTPNEVEEIMRLHTDCHMVKPCMVYISNSTEIGTIYTKQELTDLYNTCKKHNLYLFIDGARLASALASKDNDLLPSEFANLCDAFYVGGTKNGCLYGEALVINNDNLKKDFNYHIKNKGAMLAKGFNVAIQFEALFEDNLYFEIGRSENECSYYLQDNFIELGYKVNYSPTNQIFMTCKKSIAIKLMNEFGCELWSDKGEEVEIRFVTSFATKKSHCDEVIKYLKSL